MKVGLIGLGYWGKNILRNLENMGIIDIIVFHYQRTVSIKNIKLLTNIKK